MSLCETQATNQFITFITSFQEFSGKASLHCSFTGKGVTGELRGMDLQRMLGNLPDSFRFSGNFIKNTAQAAEQRQRLVV